MFKSPFNIKYDSLMLTASIHEPCLETVTEWHFSVFGFCALIRLRVKKTDLEVCTSSLKAQDTTLNLNYRRVGCSHRVGSEPLLWTGTRLCNVRSSADVKIWSPVEKQKEELDNTLSCPGRSLCNAQVHTKNCRNTNKCGEMLETFNIFTTYRVCS